MATWDGSFPDDPNYSIRDACATQDNWMYFDENSAYLQNVSARCYYPGAGGRPVYEQNGPANAFYQHPSNMVPLENTYQEHILPSSSSVAGGSQTSNNSHNVPFFRDNHKPKSKGSRTIGLTTPTSSEGDIIQSSIVQNSNLHATANEFVPNSIRWNKKDRFSKKDNYNNAAGGSFDVQNFKPRSINKYTSDNRYKGERRYDNRRDVNYRQKNPQDVQVPRSKYRDTQRNAKNYNKFQNGKYYNRRHPSDTSFVEQYANGKARTPTTELSDSFDSQENKPSVKEFQDNDSSSDVGRSREGTCENNDLKKNASLQVLETQRNKSKQFNDHTNASNYYKYNYKYKHYYKYNSDNVQFEPDSKYKTATTKYMHKKNNEVTANHKEKNLENWRDKTEDNEIARVQEKNMKKKHKIGKIIEFLSKLNYYLKLYDKKIFYILFLSDDDASQRERLTEQLNKGILECLVCYEHIKQSEYVWSCSNCYHVLHLKCIKKWAKSSQSGK